MNARVIVTALSADEAGQLHVRVLDPDLASPADVELTLFAADCQIHPRNGRGGHGPGTTIFASPAGRVLDALVLAGLQVTKTSRVPQPLTVAAAFAPELAEEAKAWTNRHLTILPARPAINPKDV